MELNFEPVYCVEQIKVPTGLPNLLKQFTKEVLREQPASLEEFALHYFQQLLKQTKQNADTFALSINQLQAVWRDLSNQELSNQNYIAEVCSLHGIALAMTDRAFQLGGFIEGMVDPVEVIVLLMTASAKSLSTVLDAVFKVFGLEGGSVISLPLLFKILFIIAKYNHNIAPQTIDQLRMDLAQRQDATYHDIKSNPHLQEYFTDPVGET